MVYPATSHKAYKKRIRKKRWAVASKIFPYEKQEEK
jgi:hypothetical protein